MLVTLSHSIFTGAVFSTTVTLLGSQIKCFNLSSSSTSLLVGLGIGFGSNCLDRCSPTRFHKWMFNPLKSALLLAGLSALRVIQITLKDSAILITISTVVQLLLQKLELQSSKEEIKRLTEQLQLSKERNSCLTLDSKSMCNENENLRNSLTEQRNYYEKEMKNHTDNYECYLKT